MHEALGEDMKKEAADELDGAESHPASSLAASVVLPAEGDLAITDGEDALVGDGDTMRVTGKVAQDLSRSPERWFRIDDPGFGTERGQPAVPGVGLRQWGESAVEAESFLLEGFLEITQELAAEHPAEDVDGEEEAVVTADPVLAIETEATPRDHAMKVRVMMQILAPGVKHGQEADIRSQVLGVTGNGLQRLGRGPKEDAIDGAFVL
jgi:hypothetical protein